MSTITADNRVAKAVRTRSDTIRKLFEIGGFAAGAILIAFGVAAIVMGFNGRSTVSDSLKQEKIVGSADMTPALIAKEAKEAGLTNVDLPSVAVAGKAINSGTRARAFASYMRIHALEASGGLTYSQMGRFAAKPGTPARFTDGRTPEGSARSPAAGVPASEPCDWPAQGPQPRTESDFSGCAATGGGSTGTTGSAAGSRGGSRTGAGGFVRATTARGARGPGGRGGTSVFVSGAGAAACGGAGRCSSGRCSNNSST